jgi:hypothetical protein
MTDEQTNRLTDRLSIGSSFLGHFITIVTLLIGMGVSWGLLNSKVDYNGAKLMELQNQVEVIRTNQILVLQEQGRVRGKLDQHDWDEREWREIHPVK